jgi:hypothetical protein
VQDVKQWLMEPYSIPRFDLGRRLRSSPMLRATISPAVEWVRNSGVLGGAAFGVHSLR